MPSTQEHNNQVRSEHKERIRSLLDEKNKEPFQRNHEFQSKTLDIFGKAGYTEKAHNEWRDQHMLSSMISIYKTAFAKANPYEEERERMSLLMRQDTNDERSRKALFNYCQEVDDDGVTAQQRAEESELKRCDIGREELEILAAQEFIFNAERSKSNKGGNGEKQEEQRGDKAKRSLTLNQLIAAKGQGVEKGTIPRACARCIEKTVSGKLSLPQRIHSDRGVLSDYLLVELAPAKPGKDFPSPSDCKYQKRDEEASESR